MVDKPAVAANLARRVPNLGGRVTTLTRDLRRDDGAGHTRLKTVSRRFAPLTRCAISPSRMQRERAYGLSS